MKLLHELIELLVILAFPLGLLFFLVQAIINKHRDKVGDT